MAINPYESGDDVIAPPGERLEGPSQSVLVALAVTTALVPIATSGVAVWCMGLVATESGNPQMTLSGIGHIVYLAIGASIGLVIGAGVFVVNLSLFKYQRSVLLPFIVTFAASMISAVIGLAMFFLISESVFYLIPRAVMDNLTIPR